ncbi:transmembrane protein 135-like [Tetranychus urticae]|uniref:Transmembrane protein 135 N-terminal domain-containing protein n=1 Tax=Tetranychus urticae TaxID=32264 RepID=T1L1Q5_TETUR|nr:transmembrane protein 135-like [Tetranychus urticae]
MPSIFSKLIPFPDISLPFNCYEVGHTWTPFCSQAALDIGGSVFYEGLKMYTGVYLFGQMMARRFDYKSFRETVKSILRSSTFLGFNAFAVLVLFCFSFRSVGKLYLSLIGHLPSIIGSYMAIHLEKPSRRGPLAFYVANIAAETLFQIAVANGLIKPVKNGEVVLFALTTGVLVYFIKKNGIGNDMISSILKLIIGKGELTRKKLEMAVDKAEIKLSKPLTTSHPLKSSYLRSLFVKSVNSLSFIYDHHQTCPHSSSCLTYATTTFLQRFIISWTGISIIPIILRSPSNITSLSALTKGLSSRSNIKFGMFLGLFASTFKVFSCLLRRYDNSPKNWHGIVAGLAAGSSMALYPSKTIAQYMFWKMVETLFWEGVRAGKVKYSETIICLTYAIACSQLFYVAVICPTYMRPSYMRFLDRFTHQCLRLLNRNVIDLFGTKSSAGFKPFIPNLDLKFTSRQFQEAVLVWTIQ